MPNVFGSRQIGGRILCNGGRIYSYNRQIGKPFLTAVCRKFVSSADGKQRSSFLLCHWLVYLTEHFMPGASTSSVLALLAATVDAKRHTKSDHWVEVSTSSTPIVSSKCTATPPLMAARAHFCRPNKLSSKRWGRWRHRVQLLVGPESALAPTSSNILVGQKGKIRLTKTEKDHQHETSISECTFSKTHQLEHWLSVKFL